MIELCFLGTGAMMPLPARRLASLNLRLNGSSMLIDCGEGTQVAMREAGQSLARVDAIFITHFHADHIAGLPGFLLSAGTDGRVEPVTIYGPAGIETVVNRLRVIAPELPYALEFVELKGNTVETAFDAATLTFLRLNHVVPCYGVALRLQRQGRFDAERAKSLGVPLKYWNALQHGESMGGFTPEMVLGPARRGIKFAYLTDTRPIWNTAPIEGADLLVCEGTYGDADKAEKAAQYGHMTFKQAAELAKRVGAAELMLTHFSPSVANPEEYIKSARDVFSNAGAARDLLKRTIKFPDED